MEGVPEMPAVPAAGAQASDEMVGEAVLACEERKFMCDNTSPAGKQRLGADTRRVFDLTARAALPHVTNQDDVLQRMQQQLERMEQGQQRMQQQLELVEQGQQRMQQQLELVEQGQQQVLQRLEQGQQELQAFRQNERARRLNRRSVKVDGNAPLQPLRREEDAAAGGAYQLGALPPPGLFPADTDAFRSLSGPDINRLQEFYGQQFVGGTVPERRKSFKDYVCL